MAITKRIEWKDVGELGQRIQNMELWNADDENGVIFAQTFAPEFINERFSLTKIRIKAWRTGEINEIVAVILPIVTLYDIGGYNYFRPDFSASLGYGIYAGAIPESDPGDDSEDWIEIELSEPLIVEGRWYEDAFVEGHSVIYFFGYAICFFVNDGAGVLHMAYMTPKSIGHAGIGYSDGQKIEGVYPYGLLNWQECRIFATSHYPSFLFELWGDDALPQAPLVQTLGYRLDREEPDICTVSGFVHPWCGTKITNKGIRWYRDDNPDELFWENIDVADEDYNFSNQTFSVELTELDYDTKYYFRVEATNGEDTSVGEWIEFTTYYPEASEKVVIEEEAIATEAEIERAGQCETLEITNHLIQTRRVAQRIADAYLALCKDPKIVITGTLVTPAPYDRGDGIGFRISERMNYSTLLAATKNYVPAISGSYHYKTYNSLRYGRMILKKINPSFEAGNSIASVELEQRY